MNQSAVRLADALAVLERTPATLGALLDGLPDTWARATDSDGAWSPYDVVGHLIQGERTNWMPRARHILSGAPGPFVPFDRTPQFGDSPPSLTELLATFADLRHANVADLHALQLTAQDLERTGQHPDFGDVTLGQLLATWVVHDMNHLAQIAQTLARVYTDAVGPWRAYLSVLAHV